MKDWQGLIRPDVSVRVEPNMMNDNWRRQNNAMRSPATEARNPCWPVKGRRLKSSAHIGAPLGQIAVSRPSHSNEMENTQTVGNENGRIE
jgi:hypothetical protein